MSSELDSEDGLSEGDKVTVQTMGYVVETFPDGGVLVDVDGHEILLPVDEVGK